MRIYTNPDKEYVAEIRRQLKAIQAIALVLC